MAKVYVVTAGAYSDYHICAVYGTKEDAEYHAEHLGGEYNEDIGVEEYELNPNRQIIADRLKPFQVEMGRDGTTYGLLRRTPEEVTERPDYLSLSGTILDGALERLNRSKVTREERQAVSLNLPVTATFRVLATDEKHAIKIANERRARLIAENLWPDGSLGLTAPRDLVPLTVPGEANG